MARFSRTETITHDLGDTGRLSLRTVSGDVRVRTVEGTVVKVVGSYEVHGRDPAGDLPPEASPILVRKGPGELEVEARNRVGGFLDALGEVMSRGGRTTVEWEVELPRGASLRLHGVSADLSVKGVRGTQEYHTVSGDVSARDVAGTISVHSVSGDASIVEAHGIALDATTTSGDIDVQAERIGRFSFTTVSGDIELTAELEPGDQYRVETVTGDLQLTTTSGVEVEASGPAVSLRADLPHRSESGRGRKSVTIGDGAARIRFRSMSGDVTIGAPFGQRRAGSHADPQTRHAGDRTWHAADPWRATDAATRFAEGISGIAETVGRRAEAAGRKAEAMSRRMEALGRRLEGSMAGPWEAGTEDPWQARMDDEQRRAGPAEPATDGDHGASDEPVDQMAVLRALERGEIDVAEATRLLSGEGIRHG